MKNKRLKQELPGKHRDAWEPFTIVIPVHNEENYLGKTLSALQNSFDAIGHQGEIIVVNDDSKDATSDVARRYGVEPINVKLRNIGAVRNSGAKACKTPWLFFLDADTLLPPKTLAAALDQLAKGAAGGGASVEMDPKEKISIVKWGLFYAIKIAWQSIGQWAAGCFMFCRKEIFDHFGGFDEDYFAAEELFFSKSVAKYGRFTVLREPVLTSARKLEVYSTPELLRFVTMPIMRPGALLKSRLGLEILYDDEKSR
jgi:glycosyltransferase involved in cell wall biosynthesis